MYNPTKFNYSPLSRETINGSRKYATPDGEHLPSVTTILDATKSKESKDALNNWRKRMGPAKAQEITTEAAGRGTSMHSILEHYIKEEKKEIGSNLVHVKASKMANVIIENGLPNLTECWGTELPVYFPKIYAGTTDGAGLWKKSPAIFDFKQTNKPKRREWIDDYFLQLCAYSEAHNELHGTNIKTGVILMCTVDLEYQEFILDGAEFEKYRCNWWKRVELFYNLP